MPGTSHSQRSSLTWFSANSGTVDRDAVLRVARFVQVGRRCSPRRRAAAVFGKGRRGDAGGLVAHQLVARQVKQLGLAAGSRRGTSARAWRRCTRRPAGAGRRRRRSVRHRPARPGGATCARAPPPARSACGWRRGRAAAVSHSPSTSASRMKISRAAAGSTVPKFTRRLAVDHDAVQRRALERDHLGRLLLPMRLEQLGLDQVAGDAGQPLRFDARRCRGRTGAWSRPARPPRSSAPASCCRLRARVRDRT